MALYVSLTAGKFCFSVSWLSSSFDDILFPVLLKPRVIRVVNSARSYATGQVFIFVSTRRHITQNA